MSVDTRPLIHWPYWLLVTGFWLVLVVGGLLFGLLVHLLFCV